MSNFRNLPREAAASLVVYLVALPLCMGIALASGVPAEAGLITGIVGGLLVGLIQGAPLQVSGPAAGLTIVVWDIVREQGIPALGVIIALAGLIQIVAGALHLGRWFRAVPPAVVHGLLAGIGTLIFAAQFHVMIDDKPKSNGLENLSTIPWAVAKVFTADSDLPHFEAACTGIGTILLLLAWNRFAPKKARLIPGALVGVTAATIVAAWWDLEIARVEVPDSLLEVLRFPTFSLLKESLHSRAVWSEALVLTAVATAETLLCAVAVDRMHHGARTKYDRELLAQGVGNFTCGMLGALPMTGVIVRSSANVQAGATTRWSAVMHGGWLLLTVLLFPSLLRAIPVASLAGVLVVTGVKLVDIGAIKQLRLQGPAQIAIYAATVWTIVSIDLLTGVVVGLLLAVGKTLHELSRLQVSVHEDANGGVTILRLRGALTFLRLPDVAEAIERVPLDRRLRVELEDASHLDHAMHELLRVSEQQRQARGGETTIQWRRHQRTAGG